MKIRLLAFLFSFIRCFLFSQISLLAMDNVFRPEYAPGALLVPSTPGTPGTLLVPCTPETPGTLLVPCTPGTPDALYKPVSYTHLRAHET